MAPYTTIKMLVADDSRTVQLFFKNIAAQSRMPIEVITAENGRECLSFLEQGDIDLAFIDVNMPDMSGMEAVGIARFKGNKTFVTLMSGKVTEERLQLARQIGAYEYLSKPFTETSVQAIFKTYRCVSRRMSTLIVDDTRTIRQIVRRVLERSIFRFNIEEAGDGESAIRRFSDGGFELVFLDYNMPGLPGLDTLQRLRGCEPNCKVIMISAERNEEHFRRALDLGAVAFLYKPFFTRDIDRAIHAALGLKLPELAARSPDGGGGKSLKVCLPDDTDAQSSGLVDEGISWHIADTDDRPAEKSSELAD